MIGRLLGRDVPATGFSIGFERVIGILTERPATTGAETDRLAIVFAEDTPHLSTILERARDYRAQGRPVLLELKRKNLGRQLHDLETRGFTRIGIVGDDGTWQWRGPTA